MIFGFEYIDHQQHDAVVFKCFGANIIEADVLYRKATGYDVTKQNYVGTVCLQIPHTTEEWHAWREAYLKKIAPKGSQAWIKNPDGTLTEISIYSEPEFILGVGWYVKCRFAARTDKEWDVYRRIDFVFLKR